MGLFSSGDQDLTIHLKAQDEASDKIKKVSGSVGDLAKGVAIGTLAVQGIEKAFSFLSGVVTDSIAQFEHANQIYGQTNAVLQSTGHAAGLSANEIHNLADELSRHTLYQNEDVQSAENMLLTFTNIGKDVFPTATQAVLDMSSALGQDLQSSAIQLGKALNDPINGVSALQRVGVSLTNSQKEVITSLVKTNQTAAAQALILKELQTEFGGSAKSAYDSASSVTKLQKSWEDLQQQIGSGVVPALNNVFSAFGDVTSGMGDNIDVGKIVFEVFSKIGEFAAATAVGIDTLASAFIYLGSWVVQIGSVIGVFSAGARQQFSDFRQSVEDNNKAVINFYYDLHDRNDAVLADWGNMTTVSGNFGQKAKAAYQETAQQAQAAADKIKSANDAIKGTRQSLSDLLDTYNGAIRSGQDDTAQAYVDQENKIVDLKRQLATTTDEKTQNDLKRSILKEQAALDAHKDIQINFNTEVNNDRRRGLETDFERTLEDISKREVLAGQEYAKKSALLNEQLAEQETARAKLTAGEKQLTTTTIAEVVKRTTAAVTGADIVVSKMADVKKAVSDAFTFTPSFNIANSTPATSRSFAPVNPSQSLIFNFNGATVGDQGIQSLIQQSILQLNRSSTLKSFAGI